MFLAKNPDFNHKKCFKITLDEERTLFFFSSESRDPYCPAEKFSIRAEKNKILRWCQSCVFVSRSSDYVSKQWAKGREIWQIFRLLVFFTPLPKYFLCSVYCILPAVYKHFLSLHLIIFLYCTLHVMLSLNSIYRTTVVNGYIKYFGTSN